MRIFSTLLKMPFIIIVGLPSSGKTLVAKKLCEHFVSCGKIVKVVSENDILNQKKISRNVAYVNSKIEKELRGTLKTEVFRMLSPETVLILDGLNYIKGFRYELYCGSKTFRTTGCTVHCDINPAKAWEYNLNKDNIDQYERTVFDGLVQRYEEPDSRNRWDSPMVTIVDTSCIPYEDVAAALFNRKPPPPNQSTQCPPLCDTNFLHEVDKTMQSIIADITIAIKLGSMGEITVSGTSEKILAGGDRCLTVPQLMRSKRQFINYVKAHPELRLESIPTCFVQYINTHV